MPAKKKTQRKDIITVRGVTRKFADFSAIEDVSFSIKKGDMLAIVGPNGSGKSTLMNILVGLDKPTRGSVSIAGMRPDQAFDRIGYVPQRFQFDRTIPITVKEFLQLVSCGSRAHTHADAVDDALRAVNMQQHHQKMLGTLSGGQLQRVLIARAILHERDVLFLDEPSSGIDVSGQQAIYGLLREMHKKRGLTVVVVTHELEFVIEYADQVVCINKTLVCHNTPKKALTHKVLGELYSDHMHHHSHSPKK